MCIRDRFEAVSPTASINGTVKVGTTSYSNTSVKGVSESYLGMSGYTEMCIRDR